MVYIFKYIWILFFLILDVGEGYYEPIKSIIFKYDGTILRTPSESEVINLNILLFFRIFAILFINIYKGW